MDEKEGVILDKDTVLAQKKEKRNLFLWSFIGVVISVCSFILYFKVDSLFFIVAICLGDLIYAFFNIKQFLKSKDWEGVRQFFIPVIMIIYWLIVFCAVCVINAIGYGGDFSYSFFLYPIFLMPGIVFEVLLVGIILMGI